MEAAELPDNFKRWPDDPFAVLGVVRGASDTDIKRAYNRLLRRFKPERFPDQFQKLRECYEDCLTQSPWYRHEADESTESEAPFILDAPREVTKDAAAELWRAAIEGRPAEAYAGLVDSHRTFPDRRDLPLRLYWLLAIHPELDSFRTRHDWLLVALKLARLSGPPAEIYRRELETNPAAMLGGAFERLLANEADPAQLQALANMRIAAAARSKAAEVLFSDLQVLRLRRAELGEVAWLALLTHTIVWTAWSNWPIVNDFARAELKTLEYLQLPQAYFFDRIDEAKALGEYRKFLMNSHLRGLMPLLLIEWASQETPGDAEIEAAAFCIADNFNESLGELTRFHQEFGIGLGLLVRIARIFMNYLEPHEKADREDFPPEIIRAVARRIGYWLDISRYARHRREVIETLAEEGIEPGEFAAALGREHEDYAARMKDDIVFRIGWLALRIARG
jgi:hypothetical protein